MTKLLDSIMWFLFLALVIIVGLLIYRSCNDMQAVMRGETTEQSETTGDNFTKAEKSLLDRTADLYKEGKNAVTNTAEGTGEMIGDIKDGASNLANNAANGAGKLADGAKNAVNSTVDGAGKLAGGAKNAVSNTVDGAGKLAGDAKNTMTNAAGKVAKGASEAKDVVVDKAGNLVKGTKDLASNLRPNDTPEKFKILDKDKKASTSTSATIAAAKKDMEMVKDKSVSSGGRATKSPEASSASSAISKGSGSYFVVAGSFKTKKNATTKVNQLNKMGYSPEVVQFRNSNLHSVVAGRFVSSGEASQLAKQLKAKGVDAFSMKKRL